MNRISVRNNQINSWNAFCLYQIKSSITSCSCQLSLFNTCYQSSIPPKSHLSQMEWETKWQNIQTFGGILVGWNGHYFVFIKFPFWYRRKEKFGVWDGNSWDLSHRLRTWSHQNPTRRCSTKLPRFDSRLVATTLTVHQSPLFFICIYNLPTYRKTFLLFNRQWFHAGVFSFRK